MRDGPKRIPSNWYIMASTHNIFTISLKAVNICSPDKICSEYPFPRIPCSSMQGVLRRQANFLKAIKTLR
jgi:hypothetical protein